MNSAVLFIKNVKTRIDFSFKAISVFPLLILILTPLATMFLPEKYGYENELIENVQLVVLLATFVICLRTKIDKKFFYSLAFVCVILFLREINCGRTIFFPIEGMENAFYSWKDIKYGYLAHPLYGAFMGIAGLYFIITKSYKVLFKYILKARILVLNWTFLILGIIFGLLGEETGAFILEEMAELLFYVSLLSLIYIQGHVPSCTVQTDETV